MKEITVKSMHLDDKFSTPFAESSFRGKCGDFVSIRPCDKQCEGKTYLGIFLGSLAMGFQSEFDSETGELKIGFSSFNPAIFVPDLNKIVMGRESWWGLIKSPDDLRTISDADIDNVWYVKALKALTN